MLLLNPQPLTAVCRALNARRPETAGGGDPGQSHRRRADTGDHRRIRRARHVTLVMIIDTHRHANTHRNYMENSSPAG